MQLEFQVIRDGAVVFKRHFPETTGGQYADLTAMALHDLHNKRPDIMLTDEDVILKWIEVGETASLAPASTGRLRHEIR